MVSFDLVGDNGNEMVRKRTNFEGAKRRAKGVKLDAGG